MPSARDSYGRDGESIAERWLVESGLRVIARRARNMFGEIDLVCLDGAEVVFIEVKTRRGRWYGSPAEAVTWAKRRHLRAAAATYMADRGWEERPYRIDVVAVMAPSEGPATVEHVRSAVGED
jgi:putative endonuclease